MQSHKTVVVKTDAHRIREGQVVLSVISTKFSLKLWLVKTQMSEVNTKPSMRQVFMFKGTVC